jgi:YidC/Oxa1 family membrane protein insertase
MFQAIFVEPLTNILRFLNLYFNDLGLAIIVFSIFLKILISPLSFLQFKEELKLKKMNEKINKLAKKEKDILKKLK